jgi:YesN/AraC family two-component response regulator
MNSFGEGNNYDIILMDLQMPEMNGFEATDYIRNKMKLDIPILALTADVTTVDLQKCKAVGMNDYISKPVDEKILYSKITQYLKNGHQKKIVEDDGKDILQSEKIVNLNSLKLRTKNNPKLMTEMISLYLKQTPSLIVTMKQSVQNNDWNGMQAAVHKMIPSFSIMGIHKNYEDIAIQLQEYSGTQMQPDKIESLVLQLERMCIQVTKELEEELNLINIGNHN